jgi:ferredoxin--NADP+ reductase
LERAASLRLDPAHAQRMMCGKPQTINGTRARLKQRDLQVSLTW